MLITGLRLLVLGCSRYSYQRKCHQGLHRCSFLLAQLALSLASSFKDIMDLSDSLKHARAFYEDARSRVSSCFTLSNRSPKPCAHCYWQPVSHQECKFSCVRLVCTRRIRQVLPVWHDALLGTLRFHNPLIRRQRSTFEEQLFQLRSHYDKRMQRIISSPLPRTG